MRQQPHDALIKLIFSHLPTLLAPRPPIQRAIVGAIGHEPEEDVFKGWLLRAIEAAGVDQASDEA